MLNRIVPGLAAIALLAGVANAMEQGGTPTPTTSTTAIDAQDRAFVAKAAAGGLFEVQSSQIALTKQIDEQHRTFAQMMIQDHQQANDQLMQIAQGKGIAVSTTLDGKNQGRIDQLRAADGTDFATTYHDLQKQAHDEAVALFERQSREGKDPELKRFATETLPTLRMHQQHLRMEGSQSGMSGSQGGMSPGEQGAYRDDARWGRRSSDQQRPELNTGEKGAAVELQRKDGVPSHQGAKAPSSDQGERGSDTTGSY